MPSKKILFLSWPATGKAGYDNCRVNTLGKCLSNQQLYGDIFGKLTWKGVKHTDSHFMEKIGSPRTIKCGHRSQCHTHLIAKSSPVWWCFFLHAIVHPFTLEELLVKAEEQIQHGMDKGQTLTTAPHHTAYRLCLGCHPGTNSNPGKLHGLELVEKTLCNLVSRV